MKTIARRAKRVAVVGNRCCFLCGIAGLEVIVPVRAADLLAVASQESVADQVGSLRRQIRSVLELHHVFGRDLDSDTSVPLCRNCHAAVHAMLRDVGIDFRRVELPTVLHRALALRRIEAVFFGQLAASRSREADELAALINRLDAEIPAWHEAAGEPA